MLGNRANTGIKLSVKKRYINSLDANTKIDAKIKF